jgi:hypothetical protein
MTRVLTLNRVPERWLWLVSLLWLFAARLAVVTVQRALTS